jgi:hypothetical protein
MFVETKSVPIFATANNNNKRCYQRPRGDTQAANEGRL